MQSSSGYNSNFFPGAGYPPGPLFNAPQQPAGGPLPGFLPQLPFNPNSITASRPATIPRSSLHTRILLLEPGRGDEMLECTRQSINVGTTEHTYEALSYRWSEDRDWPMLCDGILKMISQGLADALRQLRRPGESRRLWIDFICINQDDKEELSAQVRIMRHIYNHAARVIVWTGAENASTSAAMETAKRLVTVRDAMPYEHGADKAVQYFLHIHEILEGKLPDWQGIRQRLRLHSQELLRLLGSEWFSRVWCIQEATVSSNCILMCGEHTMGFFDFTAVVPGAIYAASSSPVGYLDAKHTRSTLKPQTFWLGVSAWRSGNDSKTHVKGAITDILSLLDGARDFGAKDERDKIFALLGISDEGVQSEAACSQPNADYPSVSIVCQETVTNPNKVRIPTALATHTALFPDYNKGPVEVYQEFTRFMIYRWQGLLDVLSHVQHRNDSCRALLPNCPSWLPSWVPNWFDPRQHNVMLGDDDSVFRAHGEISAILCDSPLYGQSVRPEQLSLGGFRIDRVQSMTSTINAEEEDKLAIDILWMEIFNSQLNLYSTTAYRDGQPLENAFCLTLIAGYFGLYTGTRAVIDRPLGIEFDFYLLHTSLQPMLQEFLAGFAAWKVANFELLNTAYKQPPPGLLQEAAGGNLTSFESLIGSVSFGRRLFCTGMGYLGLGPKAMRTGDFLCVLFGGRVPVILRPTGNPSSYLMVGEAYVHDGDIMWGNAARSVYAGLAPGAQKEIFQLV
jgi:hypothetical protein